MDGSGTADQVEQAAVSPGISTAGATHAREVDPLTVTRRFQREGRWKDIEPERDEMMKLAKKQFKDKTLRQLWVYGELDSMYPPLKPPAADPEKGTMTHVRTSGSGIAKADDGAIQGLSDLPGDWPELPANASLSAEVAWVQANRLRIVEERPGAATVVDLGSSLSPAPSWSALGWLETSIRSYAKFVDVAAKVTASEDGEADVMRRERIAIEEVEALLDEMLDDRGGDG